MALGPKEFLEKLKSDKEFAEKYAKIKSLDAVLVQAKADGYSVSKEDALEHITKAKGGELSETELAAVAGGSAKDDFRDGFTATIADLIRCISSLARNDAGCVS
ncbi:MAG: Nif11-like leader peptide family RiPP precursor [Synergistaceae bacterium]|jgi:predicted ribosomally synthesized peptide with nif11-like leader|nr:Nif11-like leader peptide family RiPP precursor [Synergistaceae bacterium]